MGRRVWNIVLIPEGGGSARSLRISGRSLHAALVLLALAAILIPTSIALHLFSLDGWRSLRAARRENASLRRHLSNVDQALAQAQAMVRDGERVERQARFLAGLDSLDVSAVAAGSPPAPSLDIPAARPAVGGPFLDAPPGPPALDPLTRATVMEQRRKLTAVSRQVTGQWLNIEETMNSLRDVGDRIAHTPTVSPLQGPYSVSAGFGWRADPFTGERAFHSGLDLKADIGTPVHATADGIVEYAGVDGEFGRCVRIRHGLDYETAYCHLSSLCVTPGEPVKRGAIVGTVGSTGRSTGPHLHYEIYRNGVAIDPARHIFAPRAIAD